VCVCVPGLTSIAGTPIQLATLYNAYSHDGVPRDRPPRRQLQDGTTHHPVGDGVHTCPSRPLFLYFFPHQVHPSIHPSIHPISHRHQFSFPCGARSRGVRCWAGCAASQNEAQKAGWRAGWLGIARFGWMDGWTDGTARTWRTDGRSRARGLRPRNDNEHIQDGRGALSCALAAPSTRMIPQRKVRKQYSYNKKNSLSRLCTYWVIKAKKGRGTRALVRIERADDRATSNKQQGKAWVGIIRRLERPGPLGSIALSSVTGQQRPKATRAGRETRRSHGVCAISLMTPAAAPRSFGPPRTSAHRNGMGLGQQHGGPGSFQAPNLERLDGGSALINVAVGASHQSISGPPGAGLGVTDREAADDGNDLLLQQHQPP